MSSVDMIVGAVILLLIVIAYVTTKNVNKRRSEAEAEQVRQLLRPKIELYREYSAQSAAKDRYFNAAVEHDTKQGFPPEEIETNRRRALEAERDGRGLMLAAVALEVVIAQPSRPEMIALMERYVLDFGRDQVRLSKQATDETQEEQIDTEGIAIAVAVACLNRILAEVADRHGEKPVMMA